MEGKPDLLVHNGIIILEALKENNLSHADLYRILREKGVQHLGEINKAFFEISGQITVWFYPPKKISQGLSIIPEEEMPSAALIDSGNTVPNRGVYSCNQCGLSHEQTEGERLNDCANCQCKTWINNTVVNSL